MENKKFKLGILLIILAFEMMLVGCNFLEEENSSTIEFKIMHNRSTLSGIIIKIEFFNGYNIGDPIIKTENVNIEYGRTSEIYKVSGFNKNDGEDRLFVKIILTFADGETVSGWSSVKKNKNILVSFYGGSPYILNFSESNW